jgi:hypothetical protein
MKRKVIRVEAGKMLAMLQTGTPTLIPGFNQVLYQFLQGNRFPAHRKKDAKIRVNNKFCFGADSKRLTIVILITIKRALYAILLKHREVVLNFILPFCSRGNLGAHLKSLTADEMTLCHII